MSKKWTLVLETCVPQATLVLACDGEIGAQAVFTSERSQEVDLFTPMQEILSQLPAGEKLSAVVVGTGPGSYNGARVGIASAQAVAQVHGCGLAGLCSFEGVSGLSGDGWAVGDARRGAYFYLEIKGGRVVGEPTLVKSEEFSSWKKTQEGVFVTFEDPARLQGVEGLTQGTSTAQQLLMSWLVRSEEEQAKLLQQDVEAFYLRAPHITKAKPRKK